MDDFEFDFEDEIAATDVGQPVEAPQSMGDRARKNYRQVRAREPPTATLRREIRRPAPLAVPPSPHLHPNPCIDPPVPPSPPRRCAATGSVACA